MEAGAGAALRTRKPGQSAHAESTQGVFPLILASRRGRLCGRVKFRSVTSTPNPDTFEKYCDTPPISTAMLLQKHALRVAESSLYTSNLYHDTPPICIAILSQKY